MGLGTADVAAADKCENIHIFSFRSPPGAGLRMTNLQILRIVFCQSTWYTIRKALYTIIIHHSYFTVKSKEQNKMENKKKKFKFNIIDVIVIVVILAVAAFFVIKFIDFGDGSFVSVGSSDRVRYVVEVDVMKKDVFDAIAAELPTQMISNGAYSDGYIVSAEAEPCTVSEIEYRDSGNQTVLYHAAPDREYVTARFTCEAGILNGTLLNNVGAQEIRIGRAHYIKGKNIEVVGSIISLEYIEEPAA